jgi:ketosteroid isomerase-like protein
MKTSNIFLSLAVIAACSLAVVCQSKASATEDLIRQLDLDAAKAVLDKDEKAIARLFTADSVINNPRNSLTRGSAGVIETARTGIIDYHSFDRAVESVQVLGKTVVVMGNETVVMKDRHGGPGETIRRRYTNIWMKTGKNWQIVARHANRICR